MGGRVAPRSPRSSNHRHTITATVAQKFVREPPKPNANSINTPPPRISLKDQAYTHHHHHATSVLSPASTTDNHHNHSRFVRTTQNQSQLYLPHWHRLPWHHGSCAWAIQPNPLLPSLHARPSMPRCGSIVTRR